MRYTVTVKPGTSQEKVQEDAESVIVWTRAKAHDGEANAAVIKQLAKHFGVAKSRISIVRGANSRHKVIEIL